MGLGLAGVEVPIAATDSVQWMDVSVPTTINDGGDCPSAPPTEDCGSCVLVGQPELCLVWRIQKNQPHILELFHLSPHQDSQIVGLRLAFSQPLSPFAFLCSIRQINSTPSNAVLLYALTVSGVAYLLKLSDDLSVYSSSSVFPHDELVEIDVKEYSSNGPITSITAAPGHLLLGRNDGSVSCFQLGLLDQNAPGFMHELRDDLGLGRLWGLMSRGKMVGAVRNLALLEVHDRRLLLFVLHCDEIVRVWDLASFTRLFSHAMAVPTIEGAQSSKLWVGQPAHGSSIVPLVILYKNTMDVSVEMLWVYRFNFVVSPRLMLTLDSFLQNITLEEGVCIDVKLTSDKIWILKDNGLVHHSLSSPDSTVEEVRCYASQEEFVADQLCQSSEHSLDDLISMTESMFSSSKDPVVPLVSSILLRRFLHPGVLNNIVLRTTFLGFNKHWTDSEFQSLTADGLKKEIILLVEQESVPESTVSILHGWRSFCSRYFHHWFKNNGPCGLFVHASTGLIGLVRKSSVSLYRGLENVEVLVDGALDELSNLSTSGLDTYDDSEREILFEVLRCVFSINQQLGRSASTIFYESFVGNLVVSSEEITSHLLKILETGYGSRVGALNGRNFGSDVASRERADHKSRRKFSVAMLLSIHALIQKAVSWDKILSVIESYLQVLVPQKVMQITGQAFYSLKANGSVLVHAFGQIAKVKFESALDILLFISYLVKIGAQISLSLDNISRIQLDLVPMIQEIVSEWLGILFLATTPSEPANFEDFSSQLSSLRIDGSIDKRSWTKKLGKCDFPLASLLLLNAQTSSVDEMALSSGSLPSPQEIVGLVRIFTSWIIWGKTGEESSFLRRSADLAIMLLSHGQYIAVECLLNIVESNSRTERIFRSIQETSGDWCLLQHLLGCCLLAQTQHGLLKTAKERIVCEAIRCFFRASSGEGAPKALQSLSVESGLPYLGFDANFSSAAWKLHYYQWVMRLFEKYSISEGACQFAICALEQVDEALSRQGDLQGRDPFNESAITIKGRLWGDVFKFTLELNLLSDAYCAIISNPDEESKYLCLRRFVRVLCEHGSVKILCGGLLPFVGLTEKIERELSWKAEHSNILAKPNLYKLLYAFEVNQCNWRRAAKYMYLYSNRLRTESVLKDQQHISLSLQERLSGLSAAINALKLVHPAYAWIGSVSDGNFLEHDQYPSKKAKTMTKEEFTDGAQTQRYHHIDIDELEREFLLTTAEYYLSLANVRWTYSGTQKAPSDVVALLVQVNLYDLAFTVLLRFWKGTGLQSELEKVFSAMSSKCCSSTTGSSLSGTHGLLLTASKDEVALHGSPEIGPSALKSKPKNSHWEILELYLGKYKSFHSRLPVIVAETLLRTDPQIELPLWLVNMFKNVQGGRGMAGVEPSPASLFRLYVDYGKYVEAAYLFLEYVEVFASMRPIKRKKPFAVWFPYTTLERLWCQLGDSINSGHMADQYDKVRQRLRAALLNHLKLLKIDSDDALASAIR